MKKLSTLTLAVLILTGCVSKTEFGQCVGVNEKQNPALEYKISAHNLIVGIVFVELIAPPIFVITDQFYCPVGIVPKAEK